HRATTRTCGRGAAHPGTSARPRAAPRRRSRRRRRGPALRTTLDRAWARRGARTSACHRGQGRPCAAAAHPVAVAAARSEAGAGLESARGNGILDTVVQRDETVGRTLPGETRRPVTRGVT